MKKFSQADLEQLYGMCLKETSGSNISLTQDQLLLHPASRDRARAACRTVIHHRAPGSDLHDDVLHEASLILARRLSRGRLHFLPQGAEAFGGWLWLLWCRACLDALQQYSRRGLREFRIADLVDIEAVPQPQSDQQSASRILSALERVTDPKLHGVLVDLAAGVSLREAARRRSIPKSSMARLRALALEKIHAEFQNTRPSDGAM